MKNNPLIILLAALIFSCTDEKKKLEQNDIPDAEVAVLQEKILTEYNRIPVIYYGD